MIKIYQSKDWRDSWIPRTAYDLLGKPLSQQGNWFIVAHTVAEAVKIAEAAEVPYANAPRKLRVGGYGDDVDTLLRHGFLNTPGEVVALTSSTAGPAARFLNGVWSLVGRFEYDHATRETIFTVKEN